jgi:superfamily II DNA or RNA helicase
MWEELSKRSRKWQDEDRNEWDKFPVYNFNMGSLMAMAKNGDMDEYDRIRPTLHETKDVFDDDAEYPCTMINTPFLTTKAADAPETHPDQRKFKDIVDDFMSNHTKKSLILRSRYCSGKTTFMQRLIKERNPERVLFITYRQTLARDIMRNFGKLGFKNYLDSYENPRVWESPRLIVQIDSLLNLIYRNAGVMSGEAFAMDYDMIVLDESESLLCHFDGRTMENKEIPIWSFFDELLKHCFREDP